MLSELIEYYQVMVGYEAWLDDKEIQRKVRKKMARGKSMKDIFEEKRYKLDNPTKIPKHLRISKNNSLEENIKRLKERFKLADIS